MQTENLWGKINTQKKLPDPVRLLEKQAALLEELTGGELQGRVRRWMSPDGSGAFRVIMSITAPYLENYSVDIIDATYNPTVYPITLVNKITTEPYECESHDDFKQKLGEILSSDEVQDYISALIAHSRGHRQYEANRRNILSDYR